MFWENMFKRNKKKKDHVLESSEEHYLLYKNYIKKEKIIKSQSVLYNYN